MSIRDYEAIVRALGGTYPARPSGYRIGWIDDDGVAHALPMDWHAWDAPMDKPHTLTPRVLPSPPASRRLLMVWRGQPVERVMDEKSRIDHDHYGTLEYITVTPVSIDDGEAEARGWCMELRRPSWSMPPELTPLTPSLYGRGMSG